MTPPGGGAHVEPWLDVYRTGELAESERLRVERHLERCPDCAARLAEIESFGRLIARGFAAAAAHPPATEPDWQLQRREVLARTVEPQPVERRPARLFRFAPEAALAVLALLVLGILARQGVHAPGDVQRVLQRQKSAESAPAGPSSSMDGREAPASASNRFRELRDVGSLASDSLRVPARPDQVPSLTRALEAPAPVGDRRVSAAGEPSAGAGAGGAIEEARKARGGEREEFAAAPADAERKRAAALNEAAPPPSPAAAKEPEREVDSSGRNRPPEAVPPALDDSALAADEAQFSRGEAAAPAGPAGMDALQRLDLYARKALASGDRGDADRALAFWRDSVAFRQDLNPARKRAAAALVDSLANRVPR